MPDEPSSVASNSYYWGNLDYYGDHDQYDIYLVAGQHYDFDVYGYSGYSGYAGDTTLALLDSYSNRLAYNDDYNGTLNSHIDFTPTYSGWYQLNVGGYANAHTGWYLLAT